MAVLQTPKGRIIGLILPQNPPEAAPEAAKETAEKPEPKRAARTAKK